MCVTAMYHQLVAVHSQHMWPEITIGQGTMLASVWQCITYGSVQSQHMLRQYIASILAYRTKVPTPNSDVQRQSPANYFCVLSESYTKLEKSKC